MDSPFSPRLLAALLALVVLFVQGCGRNSDGDHAEDLKVNLTLRPDPPEVGPAAATVTLTDAGGRPVRGAAVKLEGNMNHAGMTPVFADATEKAPGQYQGRLEFSMGGDWFVLVNATLADGRKVSRKVDVPGVRAR